MSAENRLKKIIGRLVNVSFPEWGIELITAKIDTGAYTSSIHCHHVELYKKNGTEMVSFHLLDPTHPEYEGKTYHSKIHGVKMIKSSNGVSEERIIIKTEIRINGDQYPIELSLADRTEMKYPVLIGRKFLQKKYIVDVSIKL